MKHVRKVQLEFATLRSQYAKIRKIAERTKPRHLWQHESAVREKIKALDKMRAHAPQGFDGVRHGYVKLLEDISRRILADYNQRRGTTFSYDDVVKGKFKAYLRSGIMSVLISSHIPHLLSDAFNRSIPVNPKDEYPAARAMRRKIILHLGETNTGKTYRAIQKLLESGEGVYLAPLRVLALENYEWMNKQNARCSLLTGEEEIRVDGAKLLSCTVEKLNLERSYSVAVIDEIQMLADPQRGAAWVRALLGLRCTQIHVCGALNARRQLIRMIEDCGDEYEINEYKRAVPLEMFWKRVDLKNVRPGDALIAFSKKRVIALAAQLEKSGIPAAVIYGDLPPEVRRMQYAAFLEGERRVLVSTDAIGMGVNLPIRRIVFTEHIKYDGQEVRQLTSQEVKQIAGRAGRLGIYDVGYVASATDGQLFLELQLAAADEWIEQAVVGPSEALLTIGILPLREKLALWSTREESLAHYRKMDVRDQLIVLDSISAYRLPERVEWQLMMLPFNVHSEERMTQFLSYVEAHFILRRKTLFKPMLEKRDLESLEGYYQAVNLYYAFSRAFLMPFDEQWVYETRKNVSQAINNLLNGYKSARK